MNNVLLTSSKINVSFILGNWIDYQKLKSDSTGFYQPEASLFKSFLFTKEHLLNC